MSRWNQYKHVYPGSFHNLSDQKLEKQIDDLQNTKPNERKDRSDH
jgi:hypothetical protein